MSQVTITEAQVREWKAQLKTLDAEQIERKRAMRELEKKIEAAKLLGVDPQ